MGVLSQDSPLLALPPELRNRIYRLLILADVHILTTYEQWEPPFRRSGLAEPTRLLATCRQIREESASIYFGGNIFYMSCLYHSYRLRPRVTLGWYLLQGHKHCSMLKSVEIEFDPSSFHWKERLVHEYHHSMDMDVYEPVARLAHDHVHALCEAGVKAQAIRFVAPDHEATVGAELKRMYRERGRQAVQVEVLA